MGGPQEQQKAGDFAAPNVAQEAIDLAAIQQLKLTPESHWLDFLRNTRPAHTVDDQPQWRLLMQVAEDQIAAKWPAISAPLKEACEKTGRPFDQHAETRVRAGIEAAAAGYHARMHHLQSPAKRANALRKIKDALGKLLELLSKADEQGLRYDVAKEFEELEGLEKYKRWFDLSGEMRDAFERAEAKHRGRGKRPSGHRKNLYLSLGSVFREATKLPPKDALGRHGCFRNFVFQVLVAIKAQAAGKNSLDDDLHGLFSGNLGQK